MNDNSAAALGALYQSEKADASSIFTIAMSMMGVAAAYVIGALAFSDKYGTDSMPWVVVVLLPFPLWLVASFHSLITLNTMRRALSIQIIEVRLCDVAGLSPDDQELVGNKTNEKIMDIREAPWSNKVAIMFTYGGVALAIVAFTAFVIARSWGQVALAWSITQILLYLGLVAVVALSWKCGLEELEEDTTKWEKREELRDHNTVR
jgi:hypothetical protein